jgi:NAD(P)H-nitrite reductase large subunit
LTAGVPNVNFLKDSGIELGKGIKVNRFLETNIKDIYAIGTVQSNMKPLIYVDQ